MRGKPLEKTTEKGFIADCKAEGFEAVKMSVPGRRGWPDREVLGDKSTCCPRCGRPAVEFVELKRSRKHKQTKLQLYLADLLRQRGFHVEVVHSKQEGREYIQAFKARASSVQVDSPPWLPEGGDQVAVAKAESRPLLGPRAWEDAYRFTSVQDTARSRLGKTNARAEQETNRRDDVAGGNRRVAAAVHVRHRHRKRRQKARSA